MCYFDIHERGLPRIELIFQRTSCLFNFNSFYFLTLREITKRYNMVIKILILFTHIRALLPEVVLMSCLLLAPHSLQTFQVFRKVCTFPNFLIRSQMTDYCKPCLLRYGSMYKRPVFSTTRLKVRQSSQQNCFNMNKMKESYYLQCWTRISNSDERKNLKISPYSNHG